MDNEKKYDDALAKARVLYERLCSESLKDDLVGIFPELRESEDERIRKKMIEHFKSKTKDTWCNMPVKSILDWLEKQKEQKPAEKQDYSGLNDLERAILRGFLCAGVENVPVGIIKDTASECMGYLALIEPKPAEWSEEDEEMRSLIVAIFEVNHPNGFFKANELGTTDMRGVHTEEIISWLKSLRPQPKQEVTDEEIEKMVINRSRSSGTTKSEVAFYRNGIKDAIKRFGLRPSWKPSEEQMKALQDAINWDKTVLRRDKLINLLEDLKKL